MACRWAGGRAHGRVGGSGRRSAVGLVVGLTRGGSPGLVVRLAVGQAVGLAVVLVGLVVELALGVRGRGAGGGARVGWEVVHGARRWAWGLWALNVRVEDVRPWRGGSCCLAGLWCGRSV